MERHRRNGLVVNRLNPDDGVPVAEIRQPLGFCQRQDRLTRISSRCQAGFTVWPIAGAHGAPRELK